MLSFNNLLESIHAQARQKKKKQKKNIISGDAAFIQSDSKVITQELDDSKKLETQQLTTTKLISGISGGTSDLESHRKLMKIRKEIKQHKAETKEVENPEQKPEVDLESKAALVKSKDKKSTQTLPGAKSNPKLLKREKKLKKKQKLEEKEAKEVKELKETKVEGEKTELKPKEQIKGQTPKRTLKVYEDRFSKDGKFKKTKTRSKQKNRRRDHRSVEEKISKLGAKYKE